MKKRFMFIIVFTVLVMGISVSSFANPKDPVGPGITTNYIEICDE